eukprot:Opistho-2@96749
MLLNLCELRLVNVGQVWHHSSLAHGLHRHAQRLHCRLADLWYTVVKTQNKDRNELLQNGLCNVRPGRLAENTPEPQRRLSLHRGILIVEARGGLLGKVCKGARYARRINSNSKCGDNVRLLLLEFAEKHSKRTNCVVAEICAQALGEATNALHCKCNHDDVAVTDRLRETPDELAVFSRGSLGLRHQRKKTLKTLFPRLPFARSNVIKEGLGHKSENVCGVGKIIRISVRVGDIIGVGICRRDCGGIASSRDDQLSALLFRLLTAKKSLLHGLLLWKRLECRIEILEKYRVEAVEKGLHSLTEPAIHFNDQRLGLFANSLVLVLENVVQILADGLEGHVLGTELAECLEDCLDARNNNLGLLVR